MSVSDRQQIKQPFKKLRWKITFTYWLFLVKSKFQATPISPKSTWSQFWPVKHSVHPFSRGSLFLNPKRLPPRSYSDGQIWLYSVRFGRTWSMAFSTRGLDTIQSDKKLGCYGQMQDYCAILVWCRPPPYQDCTILFPQWYVSGDNTKYAPSFIYLISLD